MHLQNDYRQKEKATSYVEHNIRVRQIYFKPSQVGFIDPAFEGFFNEDCSEFMENDVILKMYDTEDYKFCDYYGVLSWKFRRKVGFTSNTIKMGMERSEADVYSFFKGWQKKNVWVVGDVWHNRFSDIGNMLFTKLGYKEDVRKLDTPAIYCNYWLARPEIFAEYCATILRPAIKLLSTDEELRALCDQNANYTNYDSANAETCRKIFGRPYYTYYPFVCERLFSTFCALKGIKVVQL